MKLKVVLKLKVVVLVEIVVAVVETIDVVVVDRRVGLVEVELQVVLHSSSSWLVASSWGERLLLIQVETSLELVGMLGP